MCTFETLKQGLYQYQILRMQRLDHLFTIAGVFLRTCKITSCLHVKIFSLIFDEKCLKKKRGVSMHFANSSNALPWRHNGRDGVSNHQPHDCLLKRLFGCKSKKTPKLRATGVCAGNSPVTGEFPAQMASNAENVSIWWRHHGVSWHRMFVGRNRNRSVVDSIFCIRNKVTAQCRSKFSHKIIANLSALSAN